MANPRSRRSWPVGLAAGVALLTACADAVTEPAVSTAPVSHDVAGVWQPILPVSGSFNRDQAAAVVTGTMTAAAPATNPPRKHPAPAADRTAVLYWNGLARELVALHRENPPRAARGYAMLSVAQYDALVALRGRRGIEGGPAADRPGTQPASAGPAAERAAVAAASAEVLTALFPASAGRVMAALHDELARAGSGGAGRGIASAIAAGAEVGLRVLAHAATDGSDAVWQGEPPTGAGIWFSSAEPALPPLLPLWGTVRPWLMVAGDQFRPAPPPAVGSAEFAAALAEVRQISDTRTDEQLRIALYWADDPGTSTPPGHWNEIAADLIRQHNMPEIRAAWTLALLNMALMDAGISCWDAKYEYWLIRPSQLDPLITTPVPLPNFPSYTSGHSTFSGAAGELLGQIFPAQRSRLRAMAEEAAISRVYGGIHYRFDSDVALEIGAAIGRLAVERGRRLHPGQR